MSGEGSLGGHLVVDSQQMPRRSALNCQHIGILY
jgi:hypothetical protein